MSQCNLCHGKGKVLRKTDCPECNTTGRKKISCPTCGGGGWLYNPTMPCPGCGGHGYLYITCEKCKGNGFFPREETCPECHGNGEKN